MNEFFDAGPRFCDGQIFEKSAELHDECDFTGGKIFTCDDRGNERDGYQDVGLDVECSDKTDECLQYDRGSA